MALPVSVRLSRLTAHAFRLFSVVTNPPRRSDEQLLEQAVAAFQGALLLFQRRNDAPATEVTRAKLGEAEELLVTLRKQNRV